MILPDPHITPGQHPVHQGKAATKPRMVPLDLLVYVPVQQVDGPSEDAALQYVRELLAALPLTVTLGDVVLHHGKIQIASKPGGTTKP